MSAQAARTPERILVRAPNWLGDVVMSTPGLRALRRAYPNARIVGLLPAALAPLLEGSPDLDEIWRLEGRGLGAMRRAARRIAGAEFDLGIAIPESISSALMLRWGRVERVTGYARDGLRRALLHEAVPAPVEWGRRRWVSKERYVLELMSSVGARSSGMALQLQVAPAERVRLFEMLARRGIESSAFESNPPIVLAPGASYGDAKCWPVASYARFADAMAGRGERIVLVGTAAERTRVRAVADAMHAEALDLTGALDLGMLKALLQRTKLLVANDAGARHVAAAFGVPSVIFFGPTAVDKTDANLDRIEMLETEHACRPCYRRACPIDHRCLTSIDVTEALAAADRALKRAASMGAPGTGGIASGGMRA